MSPLECPSDAGAALDPAATIARASAAVPGRMAFADGLFFSTQNGTERQYETDSSSKQRVKHRLNAHYATE
jgi:hypothetical protein